MSSSVANQIPLDHRAFDSLRQSLREAFGTEFELWCQAGDWQRIPLESSGDWDPAVGDLGARLNDISDSIIEPFCFESGDARTCLVVPLQKHQRRRIAATARFPYGPPQLLLQLARLFLKENGEHQELERLRHEHQKFLRQVTHDFEELTFLRCMSRLLEISDLSFDFSAMAETLLRTLKPLLDTDALVLIGETESAGESGAELFGSEYWIGLQVVSSEASRQLVRRFRESAANQPVVRNHFDKMPESADFPGVHSFILVPIVNGSVTIGWLVALNRNNDHKFAPCELPSGASYLEFGTHEATLMTSSAAILATHARNIGLFREREALLVRVVRALVTAIEAKDEYTFGHSERVALYGKRLAKELGHNDEFCERLYLAGLLHDIGKIGVRENVLRKPGPLSSEEFDEIKQHPHKGRKILEDLAPLHFVLHGVLHHHEQFDGRGYPDRLSGCGIPLDGRILAVADAYDAITSDRPYRAGLPQARAEAILRSGAGMQWDPEIIEAFFRCMPDIVRIKHSYRRRAVEEGQPPTSHPSQPA